jgi:serine/threonine protein kinase
MASFGRYEILDKLGEGAMGVVYRARDTTLGRVVALKMLPEEAGAASEQHQRFQREAEAIGRLNHPNIVKVYDLGAESGSLYMAMELLEGEDLRTLIAERSPVSIADRVRILAEISDGLGYAHSRGVVHRDVKPANILITSAGRVKILDFGLARVATRKTITRRGVILGTPDYMAPEQAVGKTVAPSSDMFSAGAVFYEFLTLQKPFSGKTLHAVLYQIISEHPTPVLTANPDVPARLAAVVHRMLEKESSRRFDSMEQVAEAIREIHIALRRSRSRSAAPFDPDGDAPTPEEARRRVRGHVTRGRESFLEDRLEEAVSEMHEALALDPTCAEAHEVLWRARHVTAQGGQSQIHASEGRISELLARAAPGRPPEDAAKALAELRAVAGSDPRVAELLRLRRRAESG